MTTSASSRLDIYSRITHQIVTALESGIKPWTQPWHSPHGAVSKPLRHSGEPYNGINILTLWASAIERGYSAPLWMTFNQAIELGGHVRKGETGSPVVYADTLVRSNTNEATGEGHIETIPFLKAYTVFNVAQIEGLPARFHETTAMPINPDQRIAEAEAFFAATGVPIQHGGASVCYFVHDDRIQMPEFESFRDAQSYYATLAHEMTNATRHPSRLDRDLGRKRFGDEGYAREELVAELGARLGVCWRLHGLGGMADGRIKGQKAQQRDEQGKPCREQSPPDAVGSPMHDTPHAQKGCALHARRMSHGKNPSLPKIPMQGGLRFGG